MTINAIRRVFNFVDVCTNTLPQPCERDGYQDPNNCDRCKCPEGFGGLYCEQVEPGSSSKCIFSDIESIIISDQFFCYPYP